MQTLTYILTQARVFEKRKKLEEKAGAVAKETAVKPKKPQPHKKVKK